LIVIMRRNVQHFGEAFDDASLECDTQRIIVGWRWHIGASKAAPRPFLDTLREVDLAPSQQIIR
jgi:hypothetical protein